MRLALGGGALPPGVAALFGGGHGGDGGATPRDGAGADDDGARSATFASSRVDGTFFSLAAAREANALRAALAERDDVINALIVQLGAARDAAAAAIASAGAPASPQPFVSTTIPPVPTIPAWAPPALRAALSAPPLPPVPAQPQQQHPPVVSAPQAQSAATAASAVAAAVSAATAASDWEEEKAALLDYVEERSRAEAAQAAEVRSTEKVCSGWLHRVLVPASLIDRRCLGAPATPCRSRFCVRVSPRRRLLPQCPRLAPYQCRHSPRRPQTPPVSPPQRRRSWPTSVRSCGTRRHGAYAPTTTQSCRVVRRQ